MARKKTNRSASGNLVVAGFGPGGATAPAGPESGASGKTGRYLVLLDPTAPQTGSRSLSGRLGVKMASASDFENSAVSAEMLAGEDSIIFDKLGVAVVNIQPDQYQALSMAAMENGNILAIEEERIVYAIDGLSASTSSYLHGYQDAINHLTLRLTGAAGNTAAASADEEVEASAPIQDGDVTWGLTATNAPASRFTGKGVRLAVLDTGFDFAHPDFVGRGIASRSFILGESANDGHGHGTHTAGTACGPRRPGQLPRYGVASDAELYVGKVLSNRGSGSDGSILAGIEWAINNNCALISMSLGASTQLGQPFSRVFETAARRALAAGSLIIAAAGNESMRPVQIMPVSHPANCPSIMSVAAVDQALMIASFSVWRLKPARRSGRHRWPR